MKCVISTNVSVGDKDVLHRGTQFKLRYIHALTDTAQEVRDLRKFIGVVADDARELGFYVSYSPDQDEQEIRPRHQRTGHVPLVMVRAGISCAQFETETALEVCK